MIKKLLNFLQNDQKNIKILNYLLLLYIMSLITFYNLTGTLIYIILFIFLFNPNKKIYIKETLKNKVVQAFFIYFSIYILWIFGSEHYDIALYQLRHNILLLYPLLFVSIIKKEFIDKILFAFWITLLLSSIWSILMYFNILHSPYQIDIESIPFLYKSDFGFFLLTGILISLLHLSYNKDLNLLYKTIIIISIIIFSSNIFIIGARTYMIIYILIIIYLFYIFRKSYSLKFLFPITFISMTFLISIYTLNSDTKKDLNTAYNGIKESLFKKEYSSSSGQRIAMILNSIPVIQKHFIFGVGAGDQVYEVKKNIKNQNDYQSGKYLITLQSLSIGKSSFLHNTYIQHLVEFGVIGLLIFLNIFYQILKYDYENLFYKTFIQIFVFIYLMMCIPGTEFMFNQTGKFFIFIISIMLVKTSSSNVSSNQIHI